VEETLRKSEQHTSRLLEQSRLLQGQLRLLSRGILSVQEEERKRISRELHDVVAQMLTGINVRLATLKREATADTRNLARSITQTQRLVEKSVDIVHRFAYELRPTVLDDLGLIPALNTLLKNYTKKTGIRASLTAFTGVEKLSSPKRTALYRVAHEALTNVARHAQAGHVAVNIRKLSNGACMDISDDGKGFEVKQVLFAAKCKRLGLLGIRERVEMLGGKFMVESTPGKGTTIHVKFSFNDRNRKRHS
jgi:signal transduction histidine kinase